MRCTRETSLHSLKQKQQQQQKKKKLEHVFILNGRKRVFFLIVNCEKNDNADAEPDMIAYPVVVFQGIVLGR